MCLLGYTVSSRPSKMNLGLSTMSQAPWLGNLVPGFCGRRTLLQSCCPASLQCQLRWVNTAWDSYWVIMCGQALLVTGLQGMRCCSADTFSAPLYSSRCWRQGRQVNLYHHETIYFLACQKRAQHCLDPPSLPQLLLLVKCNTHVIASALRLALLYQ